MGAKSMIKVREVELRPNDVSMTHDWYDIKCECGEDFNICIAFDDENAECPECGRKYKITRTIAIELVERTNTKVAQLVDGRRLS